MKRRNGIGGAIVALEFGPSTLRFVEMMPGGNPSNQVLSAGFVALEAGSDIYTHADRIRSVLAQTVTFRSGSRTSLTLVASVPLCHAFLRLIDVPEETDDVPALLRWDMAQYLARPLDWYALDFLPQGAADQDAGSHRYLAGAYRLSEVETLREALAAADAPAPAVLEIDALAILGALAANYPECLPERTLVIKADNEATLLIRTQNGEYLGSVVQRETSGADLTHRARLIVLGLGAASAEWVEPERIFLCGDLAGNAEFREILKSGMRAPFALLNPFRKVPGPDPELFRGAYPGAPFAVAVGMALRAAAAQGQSPRLRLNLLRHLPAAVADEESPKRPTPAARAPRPPRANPTGRRVAKRVLVALALLILAIGAGLAVRNPEWIRSRIQVAKTPQAPRVDSTRLALENEASRIVAGQQRAAIAWLAELEASVAADSVGIRLTRSVFNAPDGFVFQGLAKSEAAMSRLQESMVLIPGLDLRRSESRATPKAMEFLFSGAFASPAAEAADSAVSNRVTPKARVGEELRRFLDAAAAAGFAFDSLPAAAPTTAGTFEARPFRLTARLAIAGTTTEISARLHAFLEAESRRGSPFGIQRLSLENEILPFDSLRVFLDIMAFSR